MDIENSATELYRLLLEEPSTTVIDFDISEHVKVWKKELASNSNDSPFVKIFPHPSIKYAGLPPQKVFLATIASCFPELLEVYCQKGNSFNIQTPDNSHEYIFPAKFPFRIWLALHRPLIIFPPKVYL